MRSLNKKIFIVVIDLMNERNILGSMYKMVFICCFVLCFGFIIFWVKFYVVFCNNLKLISS